jgi:purine-binding chemotaxis protein CheW
MGQLEQELNRAIQKTTTIKTAKYLTFTLAQEVYWIDYLKLKETLGMMNTTPIPQTSEFVKGVIDPRGKVIPFNDELSILFSTYPI